MQTTEFLMNKVLALDFNEKELRKRNNANYLISKCPYCGRKWKVNVNLDKQCFRCPACDESGNAIKLHAKVRGISVEKSAYELEAEYDIKPITYIPKKDDDITLSSMFFRSLVYGRIIYSTKLIDDHIKNLRQRGLSDIKNYASCSEVKSVSEIFEGVDHLFMFKKNDDDKCHFEAIPGFYGDLKIERGSEKEIYDDMKLNLPDDGFLIPIYSHEEGYKRISCLQIRKDSGEAKYIYLSSIGKENGIGVEGCKKIHFTKNFWKKDDKGIFKKVPKVINLTEGALKADIAAELSGKKFIALLGVNATRDLKEELEFLKSRGCEQINIYFDMDYQTNPNVKKALEKVEKIIKDVGLRKRTVVWDSKFKGIDDYLAYCRKNHKRCTFKWK